MNIFLTIVITSFITWWLTSVFYENFTSKTTITSSDGTTKSTTYTGNVISSNNNSFIGDITSGSIITINGKNYKGNNISVIDNVVTIDGMV